MSEATASTQKARIIAAEPTLLDTVKSPYRLGWAFLLAWVFCVFYLRTFGMTSGDMLIEAGVATASLSLFFDVFPVFVAAATLAAVIAAEKHVGPPSAHPRLEMATCAVAAIGTPLLLVSFDNTSATAVMFGVAALLTGVGSGVMWVSWGEHYARIPQEEAEMFGPASAVLGALLTLAVAAMSGWVSVAVVTSFPLISGACLAIVRKEDEGERAAQAPQARTAWSDDRPGMLSGLAIPRSMGRTIVGILAACLFVCLAGALVDDRYLGNTAGIELALVGSILFTLAIAVASIVGPRRISISFFYRWMCPALVLGFSAVALFGEELGGYLMFTMSIAARFAFCLITQMYFARVAEEGRVTATQAYGWGWVAVHLGDFLGALASAFFLNCIASGALTLDQVCVASMAALVVVTMFVIEDKRSFALSDPLARRGAEQAMAAGPDERTMPPGPGEHGQTSPTTSQGAQPNSATGSAAGAEPPDPDARIAAIAHEHGLTPRETEVFALLARGRSIPYVRDALVISRETAATHAKHIYAKLDVHSRQELIDLVAEER